MNAMGAPLPRVDGPAKVTGGARYAAEFHPDGLAYAATHDSTVPAGRIAAIDTAGRRARARRAARAHPSQRRPAALSGARRTAGGRPGRGRAVARAAGCRDPVQRPAGRAGGGGDAGAGAVCGVAGPRDLRPDPGRRLRFDPALAQPTSETAAKKGRGPETRQGDADAAFAAAPVRVDATYLQAREQHNAMEPHATVAQWQGDRLTLWSKTQWVGNERDEIARRFGISPARCG